MKAVKYDKKAKLLWNRRLFKSFQVVLVFICTVPVKQTDYAKNVSLTISSFLDRFVQSFDVLVALHKGYLRNFLIWVTSFYASAFRKDQREHLPSEWSNGNANCMSNTLIQSLMYCLHKMISSFIKQHSYFTCMYQTIQVRSNGS